MSAPKTDVRAFDTHGGDGHFVRVNTDEDLGVKFKVGDILRGDSGTLNVAMVIGIDDSECDRIDIDGRMLSMREMLECVRSAVDLALEGCPQ